MCTKNGHPVTRAINHTPRCLAKALLNAGALSLVLTTCGNAFAAEEPAGKAHRPVRAATRSESSLTIVTFKTVNGKIRVRLPSDVRPGDAIVGSTSLEPNGRQGADKDGNRSLLAGYTLRLAGRTHSVQDPAQNWNLPADLKADGAVLTLMDSSGTEAARATLPLYVPSGTEAAPAKSAKPDVDGILLPSKGTLGRPLVFNQAIPGGMEDLHVLVGDREARLLAASPRCYIVESPREVVGKTTLKIKRGSEVIAEGKFSNHRPSSGNPWPYVIGFAAVAGIALAVTAAKTSHDLSGFGSHGPIF